MCATMDVLARHGQRPYLEENSVTQTHPETLAEHQTEVSTIHLLIMEHLDLAHVGPYAMAVVEQLLVELAAEAHRTGYMSALSALAEELL